MDDKYITVLGIVLTHSCDQYYLVSPEGSFAINESAAWYWKQLENGGSVNTLLNAAMQEYEIDDTDMAVSGIEVLLQELLSRGLIRRCGDDTD